MFIEEKTFQPILVKPSDLVIDEPVQAKELVTLSIELEDFQPVGFELISSHSTLDNIKVIDVLVHHYHILPIQDNNVAVSNAPNDMFGKAFIDVYLLRVSNPNGFVPSQPQSHFCMKQYKEPSCSSFCRFIFIFFFILVGAMSESALERPKPEARKKEVERKAKAFRRE
jgi:hypothetical protein